MSSAAVARGDEERRTRAFLPVLTEPGETAVCEQERRYCLVVVSKTTRGVTWFRVPHEIAAVTSCSSIPSMRQSLRTDFVGAAHLEGPQNDGGAVSGDVEVIHAFEAGDDRFGEGDLIFDRLFSEHSKEVRIQGNITIWLGMVLLQVSLGDGLEEALG